MEYEEIFISYNIDILLDIYESIKARSSYNGIMDLTTKSSDFISTIVDQIEYYDVPNENSNEYDDDDYYNFES